MSKYYEHGFKNKVIRLHLEDGRTIKSLADEDGVSYARITNWINHFYKECQSNEKAKADYDFMKVNLNLKNSLLSFKRKIS